MKLFDLQHPWFIPLYRRIGVTGVCLLWTVIELVTAQSPFWVLLFGGLTVLCVYSFFINFQPRDPE